MTSLSLLNPDGKKVKDVSVDEGLLAGPIRRGLIYYAVNCQLANRRAGTHSTKTRGVVSGSTKKIYRQKGTGNARHGAAKAPIFVGGGITFGPLPRSYAYNLPKSARRRALQTAIALKGKEGKLLLLELPQWQKPKTKEAVKLFGVLQSKSALLVLDGDNEMIQKSVRNIPGFATIRAEGLNVYDVLRFDHLI